MTQKTQLNQVHKSETEHDLLNTECDSWESQGYCTMEYGIKEKPIFN